MSVIEVATQAYQDQKPGTSGLRKKVKVFEQPNYTENFVQAILEATGKPSVLVVGGDGRYYSEEAIKKILTICAANGVERLIIPQNGILSTPAASALIRSIKASGGIILTASHNPGGPDADFGIKYNIDNGGPAPESITNKVFEVSKNLTSYKSLLKRPQVDLSEKGIYKIGNLEVEVVDPIENYLMLMREVFDFEKIRKLFAGKPTLKMLVDPLNGVAGPYARRILIEELGAPSDCLVNDKPMMDFGGKHPDPNLTYASDLVEKLKASPGIKFGVAFDGDADRNMILGEKAFFVTPSDSLAVIGAYMNSIKYFAVNGVQGFARSFPTAPAIDRVAKWLDKECYETPTGWKFFGNLMDKQLISLCGEESFGTGSSHIREKDGLWACLAWLSIIADTKKNVKQIVEGHWREFGRDYFCRYDFEDCDATKCQNMMREFATLINSKVLVGKRYGIYVVKETGDFQYLDPVDMTVTTKQGLYVKFKNGARIIMRLSGTGSSGATVRLYVSDYSRENLFANSETYLKGLLDIAFSISNLTHHTGRDKPTVVT